MATQSNRGVSNYLYGKIRQMPPGTIVNVDSAYQILQAWRATSTRQTASSSLAYLHTQGLLLNGGLSGHYSLAAFGANEKAKHDPVAVIDSLLAAMAAAEPLLHEAKEVLAFMHGRKTQR